MAKAENFVMPFAGRLYLEATSAKTGADWTFGIGTTAQNCHVYLSSLPDTSPPKGEVATDYFNAGDTVRFCMWGKYAGLTAWAFSDGTDAPSRVAFGDAMNKLGMVGNIIEKTGLSTWLMHLDNANSYLYDDSNDDIFIRLRIDASAVPCVYTITPSGQPILPSGGVGIINVATAPACPWTSTSNVSWLTVISAGPGAGNGSVAFSVGVNATATQRTGKITVAGQTSTVTQAGTQISSLTDSEFVTRMYQYTLNRLPEPEGAAFWAARLIGGDTRGSVADQFIHSQEYAAYGLFIVSDYLGVLGREPELAGYQFWFNQMRTQGRQQLDVTNSFLASPEYRARFGNPDTATFVTRLYNNVLGRAPEQAGFDFWIKLLDTGQMTRPEVVQGFVTSSEFRTKTLALLYVDIAYFALLNRSGTPVELSAGKAALAGGQTTAALLNAIVNGTEFLSR